MLTAILWNRVFLALLVVLRWSRSHGRSRSPAPTKSDTSDVTKVPNSVAGLHFAGRFVDGGHAINSVATIGKPLP